MDKQIIGQNAGIIWDFLDINGEMQNEDLWNLTNLSIVDYNLALSCLARENKIFFLK